MAHTDKKNSLHFCIVLKLHSDDFYHVSNADINVFIFNNGLNNHSINNKPDGTQAKSSDFVQFKRKSEVALS
jgi:hypothetical protein